MAGKILPDHNGGVTGDIFARHVRKLSAIDKEETEIKTRKKKAEAAAADDGLDVKDVRFAVKEAQGDPQAYIDRQNRRRQYLDWLRAPLAESLPIIPDFDADTLGKTDEERETMWVDQGYRAGLRADNRDTCPHAPDSIGFNAWMEGYAKGQGENLEPLVSGSTAKRSTKKKAGSPPAPPAKAAPAPANDVDPEQPAAEDENPLPPGTNDDDWEAAAPKA